MGVSSSVPERSSPGGPIYEFSIPQTSGYDPAGNILSYTDCVPITIGNPCVSSAWNMHYDNLNRVSSAAASSGPWGPQNGQAGLGLGWTYDPFGNRTSQTVTGNPSTPAPLTKNWVYPSNNQATSLSYDSSGVGFVKNDGSNQYAYDTEGRLCAVYNPTLVEYREYVYDAEGRRVAKGMTNSLNCNPTTNFTQTESYVLGQSGERITEQGGSGAFLRSHVYANGQLLATYANNSTEFPFNDWLGSKRVIANANGSVAGSCINLPFGDELLCYGSESLDGHHFTGQIHDSESGNDYFNARYYSNNTGRFMSPDPLGGQLSNPQTLNRYGYAVNNPLSFTDPTGLDPCTNADGSVGDDGNTTGALVFPNSCPGQIDLSASDSQLGSSSHDQDVLSSLAANGQFSSSSDAGGGSDDSFDSSSLAGQLFGGQGLPYWTAANRTVNNAAIGTAAAYGGAFFAPQILGGASAAASWGVNASGLLGTSTRVFFSGTGAAGAAAYAAANNATTLLTTPLGRVANFLNGEEGIFSSVRNSFTYDAWAQLSTWFAEGAQGTATYFEGAGGYRGSVWLNYELPTLVQRGIPIVTVPHP